MYGKFVITQHAVERYIQRVDSTITAKAAEIRIKDGLLGGSRLKKKTHQGHYLWKFGEDNVVAVVKFDTNCIVCVTILPQEDITIDLAEEEISALQESIEKEKDLTDQIRGMDLDKQLFFDRHSSLFADLEKYKAYLEAWRDVQISKLGVESKNKEVASIRAEYRIDKKELARLQELSCAQGYEIAHLTSENNKLNIRENMLMEALIPCFLFLKQKKEDPEVQRLIEHLKEIDPSVDELLG